MADVDATPQGRFVGSRIPDSGFAGDTGAADPRLAAALADYAGDRSRYAEALGLLVGARVLVPVVAVAGEVVHDDRGLAHDKSSDMAAVLMRGRDGRLALLAFTASETLQSWDPTARPVPVSAATAAQSAIQDGAAALVLDIAGPTPFVVQGEDLQGLAAGWRLARLGGRGRGGGAGRGWIRPADG